jgi:uncharacterized protein DUF4115
LLNTTWRTVSSRLRRQLPLVTQSHPKWILAAGVLAALLVVAALISGGMYGWRRYAARRAAKHATNQAPSTLPAVLPNLIPETSSEVGGAAASSSRVLDLAMSTSAPVHVRIVADGKLLLDDSVPAGTTRHFSAVNQFEVTTGDSTGVLLELNGQLIHTPGGPGASGTIVLSQRELRQARSGNP